SSPAAGRSSAGGGTSRPAPDRTGRRSSRSASAPAASRTAERSAPVAPAPARGTGTGCAPARSTPAAPAVARREPPAPPPGAPPPRPRPPLQRPVRPPGRLRVPAQHLRRLQQRQQVLLDQQPPQVAVAAGQLDRQCQRQLPVQPMDVQTLDPSGQVEHQVERTYHAPPT